MKDLLKHFKTQLLEEVDTMKEASRSTTNKKLEYIYEDLLRKTNMALKELRVEQPDSMDADRFRHLAGNESRKSSRALGESKVDLEGGPFDRAGEGEYTYEDDEHHSATDGAEESFAELKEGIRDVTAEDFNPERLRELADVAEKKEEGVKIDPRRMSDGEFQTLLARLNPVLVDWATGKKENMVERLDQTEIASQIQNALRRAQQESDGNIDMLRSFQKHVSDSIFDTSRNMDDDYTPEYEDQEDLRHPAAMDESPEKDVRHGTEPMRSGTEPINTQT